ncbi:MAG: hypothetical protein JWO30_3930 [Fibrobacteres bacterium]|nr:hypothetical protein [Fibrobacterota bacterium]
MRYFKLAIIGALAMGMSSFAALGNMKAGVAYQGAEPDNDAYRPGIGVNGFVASELPFAAGAGAGGLGVRADYEHYRIEGDVAGPDLNEGGLALLGMLGPNGAYFNPRVGGHVGYTRLRDNNYLNLGPDVTADYKFTPVVGVHALVTPSWYINQDRSNYFGTKLGLGVVVNLPGA